MSTSRGVVEDLDISKKPEVTYNENINDGSKTIIKTYDSRFGTYMATHKFSAFSKSLLALYPVLFVACMNSAANGFDGNTFGGASSLPDFQQRFGTNVAPSQGFLAAIYVLGMFQALACTVPLWN